MCAICRFNVFFLNGNFACFDIVELSEALCIIFQLTPTMWSLAIFINFIYLDED